VEHHRPSTGSSRTSAAYTGGPMNSRAPIQDARTGAMTGLYLSIQSGGFSLLIRIRPDTHRYLTQSRFDALTLDALHIHRLGPRLFGRHTVIIMYHSVYTAYILEFLSNGVEHISVYARQNSCSFRCSNSALVQKE